MVEGSSPSVGVFEDGIHVLPDGDFPDAPSYTFEIFLLGLFK